MFKKKKKSFLSTQSFLLIIFITSYLWSYCLSYNHCFMKSAKVGITSYWFSWTFSFCVQTLLVRSSTLIQAKADFSQTFNGMFYHIAFTTILFYLTARSIIDEYSMYRAVFVYSHRNLIDSLLFQLIYIYVCVCNYKTSMNVCVYVHVDESIRNFIRKRYYNLMKIIYRHNINMKSEM